MICLDRLPTRKETKEIIVSIMGGKCVVCGYNKCNSALELHHVDKNEKEFTIGGIVLNNRNIDTILSELKKCIMVCSNCHREIEYGLIQISSNYSSLNEDIKIVLPKKKTKNSRGHKLCPICNMDFEYYSSHQFYCSTKCRKIGTTARRTVITVQRNGDTWPTIKTLRILINVFGLEYSAKWLKVTEKDILDRVQKIQTGCSI